MRKESPPSTLTPRPLSELAPELSALRFDIVETDGVRTERQTRIVLVARALAAFVVPCSRPECREGGYDLTEDVLPRLRRRRGRWTIARVCTGRVGATRCARRAQCNVEAKYVP